MALTRMKIKYENEKKVADVRRGLRDDNPVADYGNEEEPVFNGNGRAFRGFAAFKEYINRNGRPRVENPRRIVSIRLPQDVIDGLRATGRGWQTRASEYISRGFSSGQLANRAAS